MSSSARKTQALGMPFGTACNRLKKQILYQLLEKLGETTCFRCGEKIDSVDELSIEHKEPWESSGKTELFWDMNNIAFSHLRCNTPHVKKGFELGNTPAHKKQAITGTIWCYSCKAFLPTTEFNVCKTRHTGYKDLCRKCQKKLR